MLGDRADWTVTDYLLARVAHLLAQANWQRGGGKGARPKPVRPPDGKPHQGRRDRGAEALRRHRNLGLIPGHHQPPRPLTAQEQAIAQAIERARARQGEPNPDVN